MISRRRFLVRAMLAAMTAALGRLPHGLGRRIVRAAPEGPLASGDLESLDAFAEVVVPSSFSREVAEPVLRRIVRELAAGAPPELKEAAALLDATAAAADGARFATLDLARRRVLVDRLLEPYVTRTLFTNPFYYLTSAGRQTRLLWWTVAKPVMVEFYRSPLGWRVVDYARRPGECSNLADYQHPVGATTDPDG